LLDGRATRHQRAGAVHRRGGAGLLPGRPGGRPAAAQPGPVAGVGVLLPAARLRGRDHRRPGQHPRRVRGLHAHGPDRIDQPGAAAQRARAYHLRGHGRVPPVAAAGPVWTRGGALNTVSGTRTALLIVIGVIILASAPFWTTQAIVFLIGLTLIDAVFALSWNLLFGFTGLTTFGHAAFFAVGAYATARALRIHAPIHFRVLRGGVALLGGVLSGLAGMVVLRRAAGIALAILTMALGEILHIIIGYS